MTATEWRLWYWLNNRQVRGLKFRRQVPIGPYFADFACLEIRLVIEVDGDTHDADYDARRDRYMERLGWRVFRVSVTEIDDNLDGVVDWIWWITEQPPTYLPP